MRVFPNQSMYFRDMLLNDLKDQALAIPDKVGFFFHWK